MAKSAQTSVRGLRASRPRQKRFEVEPLIGRALTALPGCHETGARVGPLPASSSASRVLRAVRGHHAFEGCVEQLATAIRLGVYPRGSTLPPERELAERMGVSRATLREAIAALRAAEFVNTTRGRGGGTVVSYRPRKPSSRGARALGPRSAQLRDTLVFRRVVEPGACHIAAGRELPAQQRDLLVASHDEVAAATDPAEHRQADSRFHLAIAAVTESPQTVGRWPPSRRTCTTCSARSRSWTSTSSTPSRQHRADPQRGPQGRGHPGPTGDGEPLRRHRRPAPRPAGLTPATATPGDTMTLPQRNTRLLNLERLKKLIGNGEVDTVVIAFTDMQGRLQGKRLHASYFVDVVIDGGAEGCNYLLGVDVDMNTVDGYAMTSWEKGYGDMEFVLDYDTIRLLPHLPATAMVQCDLVLADHAPVEPSPRTILKHQLARAADLGYVALAGTELEFILFDDTYESAWNGRLPGPHAEQPVQRRLLHRRYDARRAAAARHPQHDARRGDERRGRQGRVQLRPARDRLPLRRGAGHRRQPRRLQDRRQGDRRPARQVADVHGEVQRARGQLLPHPPVAARRGRQRRSSGTTRRAGAPRSTTTSSPACWPR